MSKSTCHIGTWKLFTKARAYANDNAQSGEDTDKAGPARPQRKFVCHARKFGLSPRSSFSFEICEHSIYKSARLPSNSVEY